MIPELFAKAEGKELRLALVNLVQEIYQQVKQRLQQAVTECQSQGKLQISHLPGFVVEVPREKQHGDLATNLALVLAREVRRPPREIAELIVEYFDRRDTWIDNIQIAGPGFINFTLASGWLYAVLPVIEAEGEAYGRNDLGRGQRIQVEFVSANPTGLLHMGNARGAALGDTLANLLAASGYKVTREFYINDAGHQIENFALSVEARYLQLLGQDAKVPDDGYHGEDLVETMRHLVAEVGDRYLEASPSERRRALTEYALREKLAHIRRVLEEFRVKYDVWFSEQSLHDSGAVEEAVKQLTERGYTYEQDGALWFRASRFGDVKDEVLVRSNGQPTYFAADIAYHLNKFQRGFDRVINVWGADHHGHVARMHAAMEALGQDPGRLEVILMQLVRLFSGGEILRMSKRTGQYVTLEELIQEVGVDAARYFFLMRSADSHLDFDLDLAKQESSDNPVYYVQYAHARIASILRQASRDGIEIPKAADTDLEVLKHPAELALMRQLADFPEVVAGAARALEPHRLPRYAYDLASYFHGFYTECRVLGEEPSLQKARLVLIKATKIVLRNVLGLMGVQAPERM